MTDRDGFLRAMMPALTEADTAFHDGDARLRSAMWSRNDPVTLFGAVMIKKGWDEIGPAFEWVAEGFADCESFEYEVLAADVSGGLAYIVGIEHTTASVRGAPPQPYSLRVTTIFRREGDEWLVVHRHADPVPESHGVRDQLGSMTDESR